jgi:hypothetical protein
MPGSGYAVAPPGNPPEGGVWSFSSCRKQDSRTEHTIPSFAPYLNQVFDFRPAAARLTDARVAPEIPPSAVLLAAFHGGGFGLPGLPPREAELRQPALPRGISAERAFPDEDLLDKAGPAASLDQKS